MYKTPFRTMAEHRLRRRLLERPRNAGPSNTNGPVPISIPQCCAYRPGVKCVQANSCPCPAANFPCTSSSPSENCRNWGPTRAPTALRLKTNASQNIEEAQEAAPILCQAIPPVVFHPDALAFSPRILTRGSDWPALPACANTDHADQAITNTSNPDTATLAAGRSGKINSN